MSCGVQKPCPACPFSRAVEPGTLGGSPVDRFIGQAFMPAVLPCHKHYPDTPWRGDIKKMMAIPQCAGAAVFRANIGVAHMMPAQLHALPADRASVFATPAEFIAHHLGVSIAEAQNYLRENPIVGMIRKELSNANLKVQSIAKDV